MQDELDVVLTVETKQSRTNQGKKSKLVIVLSWHSILACQTCCDQHSCGSLPLGSLSSSSEQVCFAPFVKSMLICVYMLAILAT